MNRCLRHWAVATAALVLGALALNLLVDPLWYDQGNRLTGRNYEFNERVSKANLFLQSPASHDCLILGSSTSTIVRPSLLAPHRCVNLAFSAGVVGEFVAYARWLRAQGGRPSLVIVGMDFVNFDPRVDERVDVPDFTPAVRLRRRAGRATCRWTRSSGRCWRCWTNRPTPSSTTSASRSWFAPTPALSTPRTCGSPTARWTRRGRRASVSCATSSQRPASWGGCHRCRHGTWPNWSARACCRTTCAACTR